MLVLLFSQHLVPFVMWPCLYELEQSESKGVIICLLSSWGVWWVERICSFLEVQHFDLFVIWIYQGDG